MTVNPTLLRAFQSACQKAVQILHETHGYSRERAKRLVWHELLSDTSISPQTADPEQVFHIMRKYSLEWDPAVQALTIAQAVRLHSSTSEDTVLEAWMERLATLQPPQTVEQHQYSSMDSFQKNTITSSTAMDTTTTIAASSTTASKPPTPSTSYVPSPASALDSAIPSSSTTASTPPPPPAAAADTKIVIRKKRTLSEASEVEVPPAAAAKCLTNKRPRVRGVGAFE